MADAREAAEDAYFRQSQQEAIRSGEAQRVQAGTVAGAEADARE